MLQIRIPDKNFKTIFLQFTFYLNPWNSKENHFRFHPSFVRKFPLKLLNYAVSSSQSSDFRARLLLNFFTRWVKKFCSPLNVKFEFSECDKLLFGGCKWDLRTKQCKMSMWFYDEFHGFRKNKAIINADLNASANIGRKVFPTLFNKDAQVRFDTVEVY